MNDPLETKLAGRHDAETPGQVRTRSVTILAFGVLIIAVFFWLRLYQAVQLRTFIEDLDPRVSPAYLAATGLVFGITGLPIAWGLWKGRAWAAAATRRYMLALAVYYWLDYAFFVVSNAARGSWPFALATTILSLAWVLWVLGRPANAAYLNRRTRRSI